MDKALVLSSLAQAYGHLRIVQALLQNEVRMFKLSQEKAREQAGIWMYYPEGINSLERHIYDGVTAVQEMLEADLDVFDKETSRLRAQIQEYTSHNVSSSS